MFPLSHFILNLIINTQLQGASDALAFGATGIGIIAQWIQTDVLAPLHLAQNDLLLGPQARANIQLLLHATNNIAAFLANHVVSVGVAVGLTNDVRYAERRQLTVKAPAGRRNETAQA